jgi:hypothetical protein
VRARLQSTESLKCLYVVGAPMSDGIIGRVISNERDMKKRRRPTHFFKEEGDEEKQNEGNCRGSEARKGVWMSSKVCGISKNAGKMLFWVVQETSNQATGQERMVKIGSLSIEGITYEKAEPAVQESHERECSSLIYRVGDLGHCTIRWHAGTISAAKILYSHLRCVRSSGAQNRKA